MLLLCQEFNMEDSIRLWDTLLSDPKRFEFTNFVCVALVSFVRDDIMGGDFACCMENKVTPLVKDVYEYAWACGCITLRCPFKECSGAHNLFEHIPGKPHSDR